MPLRESLTPSLSIVVPACNERGRLGAMLDAYLPYFTRVYRSDFELIVVVNGSSDDTEGLARGYAVKYPQMRVIVESRAVGKGGALMLGLKSAQGRLLGYVDADGSTPPAAFQDLAERINDAGGIIASRWLPGADVAPRQPLTRRVASRLFNLVVRILFGLRLSDTQCGAKILRREAANRVLPHLGTTRWVFDVDLLYQLQRHGFCIVEVPTVWHDVSGSRLNIPRALVEASVALLRLRLLYSPLRFVVRIYDKTLGRVFKV
ncbi:MAG: dolichyl-phosphate beta-glucosyltransferase [Kiritimatiellia bacterium]|nr:glycosyltransferase family 2 protein [Lentisphaerota bacterium]